MFIFLMMLCTEWNLWNVTLAALYPGSNIKALGNDSSDTGLPWSWFWNQLLEFITVPYPCNFRSESVSGSLYLKYSKVGNGLAFSSSCNSPFMAFVILVLEAESKWCHLTGSWVYLLDFSRSFPCVMIYVTNIRWMPNSYSALVILEAVAIRIMIRHLSLRK